MDITSYILGKKAGGGEDLSKYFIYDLESTDSNIAKMIKEIPLVDTSNITNLGSMFYGCTNLIEIPQINTSNATNFNAMFRGCENLKTIPILDTSNATSMDYMFRDCKSLTNESLNNVLAMCINATSYSGTKTLLYIFGNQNMHQYYPVATIQSLSNYQAFIDAGWTIGWI